jgi:exonuclease III
LRIVTWNCNGALRKKFNALRELDADIYIIQECENPEEIEHPEYKLWANNFLWIGDTKNKGLGIFAKQDIQLKALNWSNMYIDHTIKYFLPCTINDSFTILGVWNHKNQSPNFGYIGQFWKYLQINKNNFKNIIIAGDFNSNKIWDQWDRWWNHSDVIKELEEINIRSLYHLIHNENQGEETKPTFFLQRKFIKSYHIDYLLSSYNLSRKVASLEIGAFDRWINFSDHLPLVIDLKN